MKNVQIKMIFTFGIIFFAKIAVAAGGTEYLCPLNTENMFIRESMNPTDTGTLIPEKMRNGTLQYFLGYQNTNSSFFLDCVDKDQKIHPVQIDSSEACYKVDKQGPVFSNDRVNQETGDPTQMSSKIMFCYGS
jgi:hypothetical protein